MWRGDLHNQAGVALESLGGAFTGKPWDPDAQLYYFPYRYYSPKNARWLTRDPLGMVDGPNVYAYVRGNPVNYNDRLGLFLGKILSRILKFLFCVEDDATELIIDTACDVGDAIFSDQCLSPAVSSACLPAAPVCQALLTPEIPRTCLVCIELRESTLKPQRDSSFKACLGK